MDIKECWYKKTVYQNMIDAANKRPLLETYQGQLLKDLIKLTEYRACLDIGCGTAQISEVIHNYKGLDLFDIVSNVSMQTYPKNQYLMTDIVSHEEPSIIEGFDLVIMSAFIDVMENPLEVLRPILKYCRNYVILHRQEFTDKPTYSIKNSSYGGWTWHSVINLQEFDEVIKEFEIIKEASCKYKNWNEGGESILMKRNGTHN